MDISVVCLKLLLETGDLDSYGKMKMGHIDPSYTSVFRAIKHHYEKYHALPSFDELDITSRDGPLKAAISAITLVDTSDIDISVAIDALVDEYVQNETIKHLDKFLDKLTVYSSAEVKSELNSIILDLDKNTHETNTVYTMDNIMLFKRPEEIIKDRSYLGINTSFDALLGGVRAQELILIGGKVGSGKSILSSNIVCNQYEAGLVSAYFSLEMKVTEVLERKLAILSNVNYQNLKQDKLSPIELQALVETRAAMFVDSGDLVSEFKEHGDRFKFEEDLVKNKKLKPDNQIIIVDDRELTITALDLHLAKFKALHGDQFKVAVVDYVNQIVVEGKASQFDWQPQIVISKQLKELARKHNIVMVSPYQVDANGASRFARGILDAADIAIVLDAEDKDLNEITFQTTKIRAGAPMVFTSGMDWGTLRVDPHNRESKAKVKAHKEDKPKKDAKTNEKEQDLPW